DENIHEIKSSLTSDISLLGKLYRAKKSSFQQRSIDHSMLDDFLAEGWEEDPSSNLKTKVKIRREKPHNVKFEHDIWCQLYELGYRTLNIDENFRLPFSTNAQDKKQIDVIAINDESILLVECKSSEERKNAPS